MSETKFTPGPWHVDTIDNEGEYGSGEETSSGYMSYAVYDEKGQTLFDSLNSDAATIDVEADEDDVYAWDETAKANLQLASCAPDLYAACAKRLAELEFLDDPTDAQRSERAELFALLQRARGE